MTKRSLLAALILAAPAAAATSALNQRLNVHFSLVFVLCLTLFALFAIAALVLLVASRREHVDQIGDKNAPPAISLTLAVLLPLPLALGLFVLGVQGYVDKGVAPADAIPIEARVEAEGWSFGYATEITSDTLHVPVARPVRLTIVAEDRAVRLHVPGLNLNSRARPQLPADTWFQAGERGSHALFASTASTAPPVALQSRVVVHDEQGYASWLASKGDLLLTMAPVDAGKALIERNGCLACHSLDGTRLVGPSFMGIIGQPRLLTDQSTVPVDLAYIRTSILNPSAQVVDGFPPVMPPFQGKLRDAEIDAIFEYLKTLSQEAS